ncbi:Holliday junction resolvase RuvX [bacterium endosymbiont of Pedicinus badii]|uniref:Holliday junction resolvase RuvX n=1 Tax=bacterium endosymbiont of Pedicinus badii TaxID=1719126 RepID=UPI003CCA1ABD
MTQTASPIDCIRCVLGNPDWNKISKVLEEWNPYYIVVGYPIDIYGKLQNISILSKNFAKKIQKKYKKKVFLQDERLTTVEAKRNILNMRKKKYFNKHYINSYSAVVILESWFNESNFI